MQYISYFLINLNMTSLKLYLSETSLFCLMKGTWVILIRIPHSAIRHQSSQKKTTNNRQLVKTQNERNGLKNVYS